MYQIDSLSRVPVYEQIIRQTKRFVLTGAIKPGDKMESVRSIAFEHSINPRTILKAYGELDSEGIIKSVPGKGYYVCDKAFDILYGETQNKLTETTKLFEQMKLAGIKESEIIECVKKVFSDSTK